MINLKEHKQLLLNGDWHVHSNYTDGRSTLKQMIKVAENRKLKAIAITEHVRKKLDYDFYSLLNEIDSLRKKSQIKIFSGIEAKVLNKKGELDLSKKILKEVDIVLGTFHSFNFSSNDFDEKIKEYEKALINLLKNRSINIWAHPFSQLYERKIISKLNFEKIFKILKKRALVIEINLRKFYLSRNFLNLLFKTKVLFSIGSDAHSADEIWDYTKPNFIDKKTWEKIIKKNFL
ncbi:MAG: PHP domain-containing protein [Candidatus Aenigmatarchaeota archaeon]